MASSNSLYEVLEVPKTASQDDIKRAYKRLAIKHHPDKNIDNKKENEEQFKKISEAYSVLGDPDKRKHYDTYGTYDTSNTSPGTPFNMQDIFNELFGGGGPGGAPDFIFNMGASGPAASAFKMFFNTAKQARADTIEVPVTIQEIYRGAVKKISYEVIDKCDACNGIGAASKDDVVKCVTCSGQGYVTQAINPFMITQATCPSCAGRGEVIKPGRECASCHGKKMKYYKKSIDIRIPKGVPNKFEHTIEGKGSYDNASNSHNDLCLVFTHQIDPRYQVDYATNDVLIGINITLEELLCGFQIHTEVYDDVVTLESQKYFNPEKILTLKGRGLPFFKKAKSGDLLIKFNVSYPDTDRLSKFAQVFQTMFKKQPITSSTSGNVIPIS